MIPGGGRGRDGRRGGLSVSQPVDMYRSVDFPQWYDSATQLPATARRARAVFDVFHDAVDKHMDVVRAALASAPGAHPPARVPPEGATVTALPLGWDAHFRGTEIKLVAERTTDYALREHGGDGNTALPAVRWQMLRAFKLHEASHVYFNNVGGEHMPDAVVFTCDVTTLAADDAQASVGKPGWACYVRARGDERATRIEYGPLLCDGAHTYGFRLNAGRLAELVTAVRRGAERGRLEDWIEARLGGVK